MRTIAVIGLAVAGFSVLLFAASCDQGLIPSTGFSVTDSAGVSIEVSVDSAWGADDRWTLGAEPISRTGESVPLFDVADGAMLTGGRIVIANRGTPELLIIDTNTQDITHVGRRGEGPGEFLWLTSLSIGRGDTIVVYDDDTGRASLFTNEGQLARTVLFDAVSGRRLDDVQPLADGRFVGSRRSLGRAESGVVLGFSRDSAFHGLFSQEGQLLDTLAIVPGDERFYADQAGRFRIPLFARRSVHTVAGDRVYVGLSDLVEIGVFSAGGVLARIVRDGTADLTLTEERFQADLQRVALRRVEPREMALQMIAGYDLPIPTMLPPFSAFLVDDEGHLWVAPFVEQDEDAESWEVFDASGRLLGSVAMPPRFKPFEIRNDRILGRRLTELDVELVEVYEILR